MKHRRSNALLRPRTDAEILAERERERNTFTPEKYGLEYTMGKGLVEFGIGEDGVLEKRLNNYPQEIIFEYWAEREEEVLRKMANIAIEVNTR